MGYRGLDRQRAKAILVTRVTMAHNLLLCCAPMRCYAQVLGERLRVWQAGKRRFTRRHSPLLYSTSHVITCEPDDILASQHRATPLRAIRVFYFTKWHYLVVNVLVATILCGYSNQMCKAHLSMEWHQAMIFAKCCAKTCLGTQQEKCLKKPKYKDAPNHNTKGKGRYKVFIQDQLGLMSDSFLKSAGLSSHSNTPTFARSISLPAASQTAATPYCNTHLSNTCTHTHTT